MTEVAFCRTLHRGVRGADVVAHKRAVSRWNPHAYPWGRFTDFYGPHFDTAVRTFQRAHRIPATGAIGTRTHAALELAHAKAGGPAFDALAVSLAKDFCHERAQTPEDRVREAIVAAGFYWYSHRSGIAYSQHRPIQMPLPPSVPTMWDCSGFVTACHRAGGAPDPNGRGYDGQGYTGTLMSHGVRVTSVRGMKPGDLVFYGRTLRASPAFPVGSPTHVALFVGVVHGVPSVLSMGHYPMSLYPHDYRSVNHYRTYKVA